MKAWIVIAVIPFVILGCNSRISETPLQESPTPEPVESPGVQSPVELAESPAPTSEILKSGMFVAGEHPTQGTVHLVQQDGKIFLELDNSFQTSSAGPDLVVILHRSEDVIGSTQPPAYPLVEGDYVVLAPLQDFSGVQRYPIPETVNLSDYASAAIWCRQFNATFGAALLR